MTTENKQWYNINSGISGSVNSICAFNDELYAAGNFIKAGSVSVSGLAKWNGNSWLKVADITGTVNSCIVFGNNLYVAGNFTSIDSVSCTNIAKWNGNSWSSVGEVTREIYKLKIIDSLLFALSYYTPNENPSSGIFVLNNNAWNTFDYSLTIGKNSPYLPTDTNIIINDIEKYYNNYFSARSDVFALATYSNKLIAGGRFDIQGITVLKEYDGDSWATFAGGIPLELNGSSIPSVVYSLNVYNNELYVGGLFNRVGSLNKNLGTFANGIAKWNGQEWSDLIYSNSVPVIKTIFNYESESIIKSGTYVGGMFSYISNISAKNIAVFSDIIEEPKTVYDLVNNNSEQCANILPCGFKISQPEKSSECGPRDGIDGQQGPPGLPGQDGRDGVSGCKIFFSITSKNQRSSRIWNNPIDPAQFGSTDSESISAYWPNADGPPSYDDECDGVNTGCVDIPFPGGSAENASDFINNFPKTGETDSRGQPIIDLSQLNTGGCSIAVDIGHRSDGVLMVYFPNPNWDGVSTGPQLGPDNTYFKEIDGSPFQYNPSTGQYDIPVNGGQLSSGLNNGPFLLPAFEIPFGGLGQFDCDDVLSCLSCILGPVEFTTILPYYQNSNNSYLLPLENNCQITSAQSSSSFISNVEFEFNSSNITFEIAYNPEFVERTGEITYAVTDFSNPTRAKNGRITVIQRPKEILTNTIFAKITGSSFSGGSIPRWTYTLREVYYDQNSWQESSNPTFNAKNFFEQQGVVSSGSGYGEVELSSGTGTGLPLVGFNEFKYKPVPNNLIVLVYQIIDGEGNILDRWFHAPNPIVGQCETQIV